MKLPFVSRKKHESLLRKHEQLEEQVALLEEQVALLEQNRTLLKKHVSLLKEERVLLMEKIAVMAGKPPYAAELALASYEKAVDEAMSDAAASEHPCGEAREEK